MSGVEMSYFADKTRAFLVKFLSGFIGTKARQRSTCHVDVKAPLVLIKTTQQAVV